MQILLMIHSIVRWLIVIAAAAAAIKFALGWFLGQKFTSMDRGLAAGFSGLIDLQATLGILYLIVDGLAGSGFPMYRIEHTVTMIIAAAAAHLHILWKNSDDKLRFRNSLFLVVDVMIIIFIGVARLPGGWTR